MPTNSKTKISRKLLENFVEERLTLTLWGDVAASEGDISGKAYRPLLDHDETCNFAMMVFNDAHVLSYKQPNIRVKA